jgi:hypothetical protein
MPFSLPRSFIIVFFAGRYNTGTMLICVGGQRCSRCAERVYLALGLGFMVEVPRCGAGVQRMSRKGLVRARVRFHGRGTELRGRGAADDQIEAMGKALSRVPADVIWRISSKQMSREAVKALNLGSNIKVRAFLLDMPFTFLIFLAYIGS